MALANLETETTNENLESSLNTEAVLAGVDEGYEAVRACLDAAEQALNEGNKEGYDKRVQEANSVWEFFTMELNQKLPSGSEVREEALNYCGDLSLMIDGDVAFMDERWTQTQRSVPAEKGNRPLMDLETARKNYAAAKTNVESLRGVKNLLTLSSSSDRVSQELSGAENNFRNARAEYLGASIGKFLEEKIQFVEAELNSYTT